MYQTRCPKCKKKDHLIVIFFEDALGRPRYPDAPLTRYGFETGLPDLFVEQHGSDTDNERVKCLSCESEFPLTEVIG